MLIVVIVDTESKEREQTEESKITVTEKGSKNEIKSWLPVALHRNTTYKFGSGTGSPERYQQVLNPLQHAPEV